MPEEGFLVALGPCIACGNLFMFDPERVCSLPWPHPDGPRQPVCLACVQEANPIRKANGLPEIQVLSGAYAPFFEEDR